MGFRFPLATVLRVREIVEQREERLLGQIIGQIIQAQQTLVDVETQHRSVAAQRESSLKKSASGVEVSAYDQQLRLMEALNIAGREHLAKLIALREQQVQIYDNARRNREVLSSIKGNQLEVFERLQIRQEQNAMDDSFSSRGKKS